MIIDRNHQGSRFSPEEIRELLQSDRIYHQDRPEDLQYPFVAFADQLEERWVIADGWTFSSDGVKNPHERVPAPVVIGDVVHISFAPPTARRALELYAEKRTPASVFRLEGEPRGILAIGVGGSVLGHIEDAIARLRSRFPGLKPSVAKDALPPARLLNALLASKGLVRSPLKDEIPPQDRLGDYATVETEMVASAVSSDSELKARVGRLAKVSPDAVAELFWSQVPRWTNGGRPSLVDWYEVMDSVVEIETSPKEQAPVATVASDEPIGGRRIDPAVLEVLVECNGDGPLVRLPPRRLDPKLYKKVDEVLRALGGKWVGGKTQAHRFEDDPSAVLEVAVATGTYVKPQDLGFFPTQPAEVERVLEQAAIEPGMTVLEPSAGVGAFAIRMAELTGGQAHVTACELLPGNARKLREAGFENVIEGDFLAMEPEPIYDRVVMNPPFNGGVDVDHVMHAARFLKPDGRLVAITGPGWQFNSSRKAQAFRAFVEESEGEVQSVESGAFKAVGTNVATRIVSIDAENLPWNRVEQAVERQRA